MKASSTNCGCLFLDLNQSTKYSTKTSEVMLQSQLVVSFYNISSLFILQNLFTLKIGVHKIFWNNLLISLML